MAATAETEDFTVSVSEETHASALLEQLGSGATTGENRPMPLKTRARLSARRYHVWVRGDGSMKLYRTNAELSRVKGRAEAKARLGNINSN